MTAGAFNKQLETAPPLPGISFGVIGASHWDELKAQSSASKYFSASKAAMQPKPAEVTAWR